MMERKSPLRAATALPRPRESVPGACPAESAIIRQKPIRNGQAPTGAPPPDRTGAVSTGMGFKFGV